MLLLLSDLQVSALLSHIKRNGRLLSLYELQSINGWDVNTIAMVRPFITVREDPLGSNASFREILSKGAHELTLRSTMNIEQRQGFQHRTGPFGPRYHSPDGDVLPNYSDPRVLDSLKRNNRIYLGSPYRLYTRALGDRDAATRTTARNLGYLSAPKSITGKVGKEDRNDWFKFSTRSFTRRVTLTLTGLTGDANLALYDARGRKLVISSEAGTADEQIIRNLRVGTYYVRVMVPGQTSLDSSIDYTLEMAAPRA